MPLLSQLQKNVLEKKQQAIRNLQVNYTESIKKLTDIAGRQLGRFCLIGPLQLCIELLPSPSNPLQILNSPKLLINLMMSLKEIISDIENYEHRFMRLIEAFFDFYYTSMREAYVCQAEIDSLDGQYESASVCYSKGIQFAEARSRHPTSSGFLSQQIKKLFMELGRCNFYMGAFESAIQCFQQSNNHDTAIWIAKSEFYGSGKQDKFEQLVLESQGQPHHEAQCYLSLINGQFFDSFYHSDYLIRGSTSTEKLVYDSLRLFLLVMIGRLEDAYQVFMRSEYNVTQLLGFDVFDESLNPLKSYVLTGIILGFVRLFIEDKTIILHDQLPTNKDLNSLVEKSLYLNPKSIYLKWFLQSTGDLFYLHKSLLRYGALIPEAYFLRKHQKQKAKVIVRLYEDGQYDKALILFFNDFLKSDNAMLMEYFSDREKLNSRFFRKFLSVMAELLHIKYLLDNNFKFHSFPESIDLHLVIQATQFIQGPPDMFFAFDKFIFSLLVFSDGAINISDYFTSIELSSSMFYMPLFMSMYVVNRIPLSLGLCHLFPCRSFQTAREYITKNFQVTTYTEKMAELNMELNDIAQPLKKALDADSQINNFLMTSCLVDEEARAQASLNFGSDIFTAFISFSFKCSANMGSRVLNWISRHRDNETVLRTTANEYEMVNIFHFLMKTMLSVEIIKRQKFENVPLKLFVDGINAIHLVHNLLTYPGVSFVCEGDIKPLRSYFLYVLNATILLYQEGSSLGFRYQSDTRSLDDINRQLIEKKLPERGYPEIPTPIFHYDYRHSIFSERLKAPPKTQGIVPNNYSIEFFNFTKLDDIDRVIDQMKEIETKGNIPAPAYRVISNRERNIVLGLRVVGRTLSTSIEAAVFPVRFLGRAGAAVVRRFQ